MANNRNNQGTGFVNYDDILNANQNSGKRMGQAVSSGLQSQAQSVNQNLQDQQNQFNQGLKQSQDNWSNVSQLANQLAQNGMSGNWGAVANASTDANGNPVNFNVSGNNFRNYKYSGPTGLENASGLQTQAQSASEAGRLAGSAQGQQQLLNQYVGGQNYNQGQAQFDQALLNKYGRGDINQARRGLTGLAQQANNAVSGAQSAANTQKNLISAQKQDYLNKISNSLGNESDGSGVLGAAKNQANQFNTDATNIQQIMSAIVSDKKSQLADNIAKNPELLNRFSEFGIDPGSIYRNDKSNYNMNKIRDLANLYTTPALQAGGVKFEGDQQQAAANLANFLNDPRASQIMNSKWDSNVFKADKDVLNDIQSKLGQEKDYDTRFSEALNKLSPVLHGFNGTYGSPMTIEELSRQNTPIAGSRDLMDYLTKFGQTAANANIDPFIYTNNDIVNEYFTDEYNQKRAQPLLNSVAPNSGFSGTLGWMGGYNRNAASPMVSLAAMVARNQNPFSSSAGNVGTDQSFANIIKKLTQGNS